MNTYLPEQDIGRIYKHPLPEKGNRHKMNYSAHNRPWRHSSMPLLMGLSLHRLHVHHIEWRFFSIAEQLSHRYDQLSFQLESQNNAHVPTRTSHNRRSRSYPFLGLEEDDVWRSVITVFLRPSGRKVENSTPYLNKIETQGYCDDKNEN